MKKTIRILALTMALLMVAVVFASCAKTLSGTYTGEADLFGLAGATVTYKFSGSNVTITSTGKLLGMEKTETKEAKYEITEKDDGTMSITFTYDDGKTETQTFKEDKDAGTITIGLVTLTKK